jgi:hypothetical protein
MKKLVLLFLLVAPILSQASDFSKLRQENLTITEIISNNKEQEKAQPCTDFAKSKDEVISYLLAANKISGETAHQQYDVYHCSVSGNFKIEEQEYKFTIHAGGLGYVLLPNNNQIILGCKDQCCKKSPSICWQ